MSTCEGVWEGGREGEGESGREGGREDTLGSGLKNTSCVRTSATNC